MKINNRKKKQSSGIVIYLIALNLVNIDKRIYGWILDKLIDNKDNWGKIYG